MATTQLKTPVIEGGLLWTHFFNGRLISAEDLTRDQTENDRAHRRLGRAIGHGVAFGLEVEIADDSTREAPALAIAAGSAINRCGQALVLPEDTRVALTRPESATEKVGGAFDECETPQGGTYLVGEGVYLLTLAPAAVTEGRAPTGGLNNLPAPCNYCCTVEGVQFRLLEVTLDNALLADRAHLRNRVAHECYGTTDARRAAQLLDPMGASEASYGLLEDPERVRVGDCEVPLALVHWTIDGLQFADAWSVRRPPRTRETNPRWLPASSPRLLAEGEASFRQFQREVDELWARSTNPAQARATDRFAWLPACGLLPATELGAARLFSTTEFFATQVTRGPLHLSVDRVEDLLRESFAYPPIDLASDEFVWLYRIVEPSRFGLAPAAPIPWVVFASGRLPYRGTARFDLARWDLNEYEPL